MFICQLQRVSAYPDKNSLASKRHRVQALVWQVLVMLQKPIAIPVRISKKICRALRLMPVIDRANGVYDIAGRQVEAPMVQQTLCSAVNRAEMLALC